MPYYTVARDWLKPKGVSALTDRSGVVYYIYSPTLSAQHVTCESLPFMDNDHVEQWQRVSLWGGGGGGETGSNKKEKHITGIGLYCAHCSVLCIKLHKSVHIIVACV